MPGFDIPPFAAELNPPPDPTESLAQVAALQNAFNQNKMFQANALAGQYLEQSLGPDGNVDPTKLNSLLQSDPRTAPAAAEIMQRAFATRGQGLTNQRSAVGLQSDQAGLASAYTGNLNQDLATAGTSSSNSDPAARQIENRRAAVTAIGAGVASGRYSQQFATNYLANLGNGDGSGLDGDIRKAVISGAGGSEAQTALTGKPTPVQTGGGTQFESINPYVGAGGTSTPMSGPGAFVSSVQSPETMGQMVGYTGPDGSTHQVSRATVQNANGTMKPNVRDAQGNPITDATGALTVALNPNDMALLNSTATNQADRASALQTAFEGSSQRKAIMQDMLATQGDFRSGPGAARWAGIVTEFNRVFGTKFASDANSSQQVFGKMAEMLAAQQRQTLGLPATNAGAEAAQIASPNSAYDPEANRQVLAQLTGNEDYLQRKQAAWTWYQQHGGKQFNVFVTQYNHLHDPRSFWEPYMTPTQLKTMMGAMTPAQRQQYEAGKAASGSLDFGK